MRQEGGKKRNDFLCDKRTLTRRHQKQPLATNILPNMLQKAASEKLAERSTTHLPLYNSPKPVGILRVLAEGKLAVLRLQISFASSPPLAVIRSALPQVGLWGEWW